MKVWGGCHPICIHPSLLCWAWLRANSVQWGFANPRQSPCPLSTAGRRGSGVLAKMRVSLFSPWRVGPRQTKGTGATESAKALGWGRPVCVRAVRRPSGQPEQAQAVGPSWVRQGPVAQCRGRVGAPRRCPGSCCQRQSLMGSGVRERGRPASRTFLDFQPA